MKRFLVFVLCFTALLQAACSLTVQPVVRDAGGNAVPLQENGLRVTKVTTDGDFGAVIDTLPVTPTFWSVTV